VEKLIEELLTNLPDGGRSLVKALQLSERLNLKTKVHLKVLFTAILILGKLYLNDTRN
jgi:hypothetical protein